MIRTFVRIHPEPVKVVRWDGSPAARADLDEMSQGTRVRKYHGPHAGHELEVFNGHWRPVKHGDWVVLSATGSLAVVPPEEFAVHYVPSPE